MLCSVDANATPRVNADAAHRVNANAIPLLEFIGGLQVVDRLSQGHCICFLKFHCGTPVGKCL